MASIKTYPCCICGTVLENPRSRKSHMAASPHQVLRVVCPWCPVENTCSGMGDFKKHVLSAHQETGSRLPPEFFADGNGVWLAQDPVNYGRVIKKLSKENSEEAVLVKSLVKQWLSGVRNSSRSKEQWEDGWRLIVGNAASSEAPSVVTSPEAVPAQARTPLPSECGDEPSPAKRPCWDPLSLAISKDIGNEAYSPNHPEIEPEYFIVRVDTVARNVIIKASLGPWYIVTVDQTVLQDPRSLASIRRRVESQRCHVSKDMPPGTDEELTGLVNTAMLPVLSKAIGIAEGQVKCINVRKTPALLPVPFPTYGTPCFSPRVREEDEL